MVSSLKSWQMPTCKQWKLKVSGHPRSPSEHESCLARATTKTPAVPSTGDLSARGSTAATMGDNLPEPGRIQELCVLLLVVWRLSEHPRIQQ